MSKNRHRYRNQVRLPVILFLLIAGGLIGARWIREVSVQAEQNKLSTRLRDLNHRAAILDQDINDLRGRETALVAEDVLIRRMAEGDMHMNRVDQSQVIDATRPHASAVGSVQPTHFSRP
jgi:outer membrane murein-binding lipoprotein Lpp